MKYLIQSVRIQVCLVFFSALIVIGVQLFFIEKETPYADHISYMSVALPLLETGIYEDGTFRGTVLNPGENNEGMFFAPLYPAFLSGIMAFSDGFRDISRCSIEFRKPPLIEKECDLSGLKALWLVQAIVSAGSAVFIWLGTMALFKRPILAWLTTFSVVTLGTFAYFSSIVMAETLILFLFYMACYFLILSWQHQKWYWALLTGLATGALLLTKPSFIYLFYFLIVVMFCLGGYQFFRLKTSWTLKLVLLAFIGCALITSPWIYRNYTKLDHTAITFGYGAFTLSQRVAYNDMTMTEWLVSWIYGIPGEGDSIAEKLFPKEYYERWEWDNQDGFYYQGNKVLRHQTLEAAGSHEDHLSYLLKNYVVADLPVHIATTFPLIFRGMWVFELWVFIPYLAFIILCLHCLKTRKYDYLLYALPPWFMLGLHGFASVNIPRYNIILQSCLGMALAWAALELWNKYKVRQSFKRSLKKAQ